MTAVRGKSGRLRIGAREAARRTNMREGGTQRSAANAFCLNPPQGGSHRSGPLIALVAHRGTTLFYPPGEDISFPMATSDFHESHPGLIVRLRRADGHLRAVIEMIEAGKPCLEIAQQMQAVEKAITNAKRALIHDHMDHCLDAEGSETDRAELRTITRYL